MATRGDSASTIKEMWQRAERDFEQRAGTSLRQSPAKTMDDCRREIEMMGKSETLPGFGNASRSKNAKQLGIRTLHCIKLLGGLVAEGTSKVFPPSKLCFNALCLLLDIPSKLHAFHKAIAGLFKELGPSLSMFRIYDTMDNFNLVGEHMKYAIQRIMISFVNICGLFIKLRDSGRWSKFKIGAKHVLFDDDSDIRNEMKVFQELTKAHGEIQGTQTLKTVIETNETLASLLSKAEETVIWQVIMDGEIDKVNNIAESTLKHVCVLKDSEDKRKSERAHERNLENIKKKLCLSQSSIDASRDTCDKLQESAIDNTAEWLKDDTQFQKWADRDDPTRSLFIISGDKNTGKSVVMAAVSQHLQWKKDLLSPMKSQQTLVADYFFPSPTGKYDDDKRTVQTALKCIAFQFAKQCEIYATTLSQKCNRMPTPEHFRNSTCDELWASLGIATAREDFVHYILIDGLSGLSDASKEQQRQLCHLLSTFKPEQSNVRVLISLRPDQALGGEPHRIRVEEHNSLDIKKYIDSEMKKGQMFQDTDETSVRMREKMESIVATSNGSYSKVNAILAQINMIILADGPESDIDQILSKSSMDEKSLSKSIIPELEAALSPQEIEELNELLRWVIFGKERLDVHQLTAALYIRFKTRSLLGLERKLKGKYSRILGIHRDGFVELNDNSLTEWLTKEREGAKVSDAAPTFTATISVSNADASTMNSFPRSFSLMLTCDSFGSQKIINQSIIEQSKAKIQVNEVDSHLAIVRSTFDFLKDAPDKSTHSLGLYMLAYLPDHLKHLVEARLMNALTTQEKQDVTDGVFNLLCSERSVLRHWDACERVDWFRDPNELMVFQEWLADESATRHLSEDHQEFLRHVMNSRNPGKALLFAIMKAVAGKWAMDSQWEIEKPYQWISGYLALPETEITDDDGTLSDMVTVSSAGKFPSARIQEVEDWCAETLAIDTKNALWHRRIGTTGYEIGEYRHGIESFRASLQQSRHDPYCLEGLARCLDQEREYDVACEHLAEAIDILGKQEQINISDLRAKCVDLAEWYNRKLQQPGRAIAFMKETILKLPQEPQLHFSLLKLYLTNSQQEDATNLLHEFFGEEDHAEFVDQILVCILMDDEGPEFFSTCLYLLRGQSRAQESVVEALETAAKKAEEAEDMDQLMASLLFKGVAIYHFIDDKEIPHEKAITCWDRCLKLKYQGECPWFRDAAYILLCAHHFNHARSLDEPQHKQSHIASLNDLLGEDMSSAPIAVAASYLASYYAIDNIPKAREILQQGIVHAFIILSDDIDENDRDGFYALAAVLLHCGDETNALVAHQFLLPGPAAGDLLSWLLEFENEPTRSIATNLVSDTLRGCEKDAQLHDQLNFAHRLVQHRLTTASKTSSSSSDFDTEDTDEQFYKSACIEEMNGEMTPESMMGSLAPTSLEHLSANLSESQTHPTAEDLDLDEKLDPKEDPKLHTVEAYREIQAALEQWLRCKKYGRFHYTCDGCGEMWNLENAMNVCKYCHFRRFCDDCLADLKADELSSRSFLGLVCRRDHEWLRLPKWEKEQFIAAFKGNVTFPDRQNAKERTLIPVDQWFASIKKDWGIKDDNKDMNTAQMDAD